MLLHITSTMGNAVISNVSYTLRVSSSAPAPFVRASPPARARGMGTAVFLLCDKGRASPDRQRSVSRHTKLRKPARPPPALSHMGTASTLEASSARWAVAPGCLAKPRFQMRERREEGSLQGSLQERAWRLSLLLENRR